MKALTANIQFVQQKVQPYNLSVVFALSEWEHTQ